VNGWRATAVVAVAVLQIGAGAVGGIGLWGEPVGDVANSYPTLLLPAGAAFGIWSLIYFLFAALAIRQALPRQRAREVHRRTGWWLAAAGMLNAAWVALFAHRLIVPAQLVIVGLLACLVIALVRVPARGWGDRLLLHTPIAIYAGWVAIAVVAGGATTSAWFGAPPSTVAAIIVVLLAGGAVTWAVLRLRAVVGFATAVCWALTWVAIATPAPAVRSATLIALGIVLLSLALRLTWTDDRTAAAWG